MRAGKYRTAYKDWTDKGWDDIKHLVKKLSNL